MGILLTGEQAAATGSGIVLILYIVIIVAFMYFIMIRPQKKEQKRMTKTAVPSFTEVLQQSKNVSITKSLSWYCLWEKTRWTMHYASRTAV